MSAKVSYMNCSSDTAASVFKKWQEESSLLLIDLAGVGFKMSTPEGWVDEFSPNTLLLSWVDKGSLLLRLEDASFFYVEPVEDPPDIREETEATFTSALRIKFPDLTLTLSEMPIPPIIEA
jgi:hypothetical protein